MKKTIAIILEIFFLIGCGVSPQPSEKPKTDSYKLVEVKPLRTLPAKSLMAMRLDSLGYINVAEADSTILVDLAYSHPNNFTGVVLYETLREAYLHPLAMESLKKANTLLKAKFPQYQLLVLDAARPMSVQKQMWEKVKGTPKNIYVSNPNKGGGMHNYGMAVDVTIVDEKGNRLPMGTPFDHFGLEAHITNEEDLVQQGLISFEEKQNRRLLRSIMREAGFITQYNEWWHFNRLSKAETIHHYTPIE